MQQQSGNIRPVRIFSKSNRNNLFQGNKEENTNSQEPLKSKFETFHSNLTKAHARNYFETNESLVKSSDIIITQEKIITLKKFNTTVNVKCGHTIELEDEYRGNYNTYYHESSHKNERGSKTIEHQKRNPNNLCILYNHVPEQIILKQNENTVAHKFIMTVDKKYRLAKQEMVDGKICLVKFTFHEQVFGTFHIATILPLDISL